MPIVSSVRTGLENSHLTKTDQSLSNLLTSKLKITSWRVGASSKGLISLSGKTSLLKFIRPQSCAFMLNVDKLHVGIKCYSYDPLSDKIIENNPPVHNPVSSEEANGINSA